jgi:hypothetical protein
VYVVQMGFNSSAPPSSPSLTTQMQLLPRNLLYILTCNQNTVSRKIHLHFKRDSRTPWPESANELYRPGDSHLSEKLVPTFAGRGSRSQRGGSLTAVISAFQTGAATFSFK